MRIQLAKKLRQMLGHVVNDPMTQRDLADPMTQLDSNDPTRPNDLVDPVDPSQV